MRITFLGTGTSHGVPIIACDCSVCQSDDPRNKRTRTSVYIEDGDSRLLIDASPELRLQCLANGVDRIDAVLLTHSHADHIFGLDDLRRFNHIQKGPVSIYGEPETLDRIGVVFSYAFGGGPVGGGKPKFDLHQIDGPFQVGQTQILPLRVWHGEASVTAFRMGRFAYVTDTSRIPHESFEQLRGLHTLVLDGLRYRPHVTHLNVEQAVEVVQALAPERAYLTHMTHDLDYVTLSSELPDGIEPAYDGLAIEVG